MNRAAKYENPVIEELLAKCWDEKFALRAEDGAPSERAVMRRMAKRLNVQFEDSIQRARGFSDEWATLQEQRRHLHLLPIEVSERRELDAFAMVVNRLKGSKELLKMERRLLRELSPVIFGASVTMEK
jgi:ribosomal protein L13E